VRVSATRGAHVLLGTTRGWTVRAGRAAWCELEPTVLSRVAACGCRDDDTSAPRGGDDEDDPDMSLQLTAALATSPLHDCSGDGSSSEDTPSTLAFHLLMRLSLRSRLAIWRFLCCALRTSCLFSAATLFQVKIASSGRGALAEMRCVHFNYNDKRHGGQPRKTSSEKINIMTKANKIHREEQTTYNFFCPCVGEHREQPRRWPRVGRSPDCLHHATLDLERQWERRRGHGSLLGGPVSRHLAEAKRPPPELHDTSGVVLPDHFRQGDSGSSETP
jgi:hypothetical protein